MRGCVSHPHSSRDPVAEGLSSLKSAKARHRDCKVVRRRGKVFVICKSTRVSRRASADSPGPASRRPPQGVARFSSGAGPPPHRRTRPPVFVIQQFLDAWPFAMTLRFGTTLLVRPPRLGAISPPRIALLVERVQRENRAAMPRPRHEHGQVRPASVRPATASIRAAGRSARGRRSTAGPIPLRRLFPNATG